METKFCVSQNKLWQPYLHCTAETGPLQHLSGFLYTAADYPVKKKEKSNQLQCFVLCG